MKATVDILMATYNGAQFLEEQLQSLLDQTYSDWNLIIHDDGSEDDTFSIIKAFQQKDSRIELLEDGIVFKSSSANFMHLLSYSTIGQLVIFCDQDDIWLSNKLEVLVKTIMPESGPCAVYCNSYLMQGTKVSAAMATLFERTNLRNSLFLNSGVQGNSLMVNRQLLNLLKEFPDFIYMHDHFITIAALTFGKVIPVNIPLMHYRQHAGNVTGNVESSYYKRVFNFFSGTQFVVDKAHFEAVYSFYLKYENYIRIDNRLLFQAYFDYVYSKSVLRRLRIVNKFGFRIGKHAYILLLKTLLRKPISKQAI